MSHPRRRLSSTCPPAPLFFPPCLRPSYPLSSLLLTSKNARAWCAVYGGRGCACGAHCAYDDCGGISTLAHRNLHIRIIWIALKAVLMALQMNNHILIVWMCTKGNKTFAFLIPNQFTISSVKAVGAVYYVGAWWHPLTQTFLVFLLWRTTWMGFAVAKGPAIWQPVQLVACPYSFKYWQVLGGFPPSAASSAELFVLLVFLIDEVQHYILFGLRYCEFADCLWCVIELLSRRPQM